MENSAAHWCKSVIEEVVQPRVGNVYSSQTTANNTATSAGFVAQNLNPQYMQMYQDFYKQQAAAISGQNYYALSQQLPIQQTLQVEPPSYKAILTQNKQPQLSDTSTNINPWNTYSTYQAIASTTSSSVAPPVDPRTQKKPNPSRFTSISSATNIQNIASSGNQNASNPSAANSQGVKQPNSMNEFVKRAFAACASDTDRAVITAELQKLIQKVSADGRVNIHRWDLEPTPVPPSVKAAAAAALSIKTQAVAAEDSKKRKSRWGGGGNEELHPMPPSPSPSTSVSFVYNASAVGEPAKKKSALSGREAAPTREELQMREKRANRFQDDHKLMTQRDSAPVLTVNGNNNNKKGGKNKKKVQVSIGGSTSSGSAQDGGGDTFDMESLKIVGTCSKLEKDYLRLTSAPHHSVVRPESVLRKTVQLLKKKWAAEEVDYVYMCSQLKSLRQDLTVQHIANDFSVHVYETHARVALESNDMNEYNQCQTQLKHLYAAGHKGSEMEFVAYLILYYVYLLGNKKYTLGSSDLVFLLASLKPEAYSNDAVTHALKVRRAVQLDNYHQFFVLYKTTPNMGNYLLDLMVGNFRLQALQKIVRAYKPSLPLDFAMRALGLEDSLDEGLELLKKAGCVLTQSPEGEQELNTKDSVVDMAAFLTQEKLLL